MTTAPTSTTASRWPELPPLADWQAPLDTVSLWT